MKSTQVVESSEGMVEPTNFQCNDTDCSLEALFWFSDSSYALKLLKVTLLPLIQTTVSTLLYKYHAFDIKNPFGLHR